MKKIHRALLLFLILEFILLGIYKIADRWSDRHLALNVVFLKGLSAEKLPLEAGNELSLDFLERLPIDLFPRTNFRVQWSGFWYVPVTELYRVSAAADDAITLKVDDRLTLRRGSDEGSGHRSEILPLSAGFHQIQVDYSQREGAYAIKTALRPVSLGLHQFWSPAFFPAKVSPTLLTFNLAINNLCSILGFILFAAPLLFSGLLVHSILQQRRFAQGVIRKVVRIGRTAIPLLILLYAAALRFEALSIKHGPVLQPPWLHTFEQKALPVIGKIRPSTLQWRQGSNPYEKGDPMNYLRMARNMESFYAAQFREPMYVFVTKQSLGVFRQQDIAVSFGSAFFSILAVAATYILGSAAFSWPVGVLSMLFMTVEQEVISLGVDGWRDDTFMLLVLMSAYAFVRLLKNLSFGNAIFAGFACAGACLTRLTSFSFILPAFAFLILFSAEPSLRKRVKTIGLSLLVLGILIAPFLINCAIVYGDPLFSINDNTKFYRSRENLDSEEPMTVSQYLLGKLEQRPIKLIDTGFAGLTSYPFENKWKGVDYILPEAGRWLALFSVAGLFLFLLSNQGRLLLLVLITSLIPYAFTWQIPGGSELRFTLHAYPFYLIAAALSMTAIVTIIYPRSFWRSISASPPTERRILTSFMLIVAIMVAGWLLLNELNYLRKLESVKSGDSMIIEAGDRDAFFFKKGWFSPVTIQQNPVRIGKGGHMIVSVPLSRQQKYLLLVGLNRLFADEKYMRGLKVFLNGAYIGEIPIQQSDPLLTARRVRLPEGQVQEGSNKIQFSPIYPMARQARVQISDPISFSYVKAQVIDAYRSGVEKYKVGDFDGAISDLEKALKTEKQKSSAYYYLGLSQLEQGYPDKAIASLNHALQLSRGNPLILEARGKAYLQTKQYDLAVKDLQKVLKQQTDNIEVNYYLAMALRGIGNINESNLYLEKILELNPRHPLALKARKELGRFQR